MDKKMLVAVDVEAGAKVLRAHTLYPDLSWEAVDCRPGGSLYELARLVLEASGVVAPDKVTIGKFQDGGFENDWIEQFKADAGDWSMRDTCKHGWPYIVTVTRWEAK